MEVAKREINYISTGSIDIEINYSFTLIWIDPIFGLRDLWLNSLEY